MPTTVPPMPGGFSAITPYLIVNDAAAALSFYQRVFHAAEVHILRAPDGSIRHASIRIGSAMVMVGQHPRTDAHVEGQLPQLSLYAYVENADDTWQSAIDNGASSIYPVSLKPYGNREGGVRDPFGITWWIATQVELVSDDEIARRMNR